MASIPTVDFSQYQWVVNDTNYLTKWNNFQTAINTLQANINKFGAEAKAESDSAIGIAQSLIESYNVNVLDAYSVSTTLGFGFIDGRYTKDDGERTDTNDPEDLLSITRPTPKWTEGPNGLLREVAAGAVARKWRNNEPQGVPIEEKRTNEYHYSDLTNAVVSGGGYSNIIDSDYWSGSAIVLGNGVSADRAYLDLIVAPGVATACVSFVIETPMSNPANDLLWYSRSGESNVGTKGDYDPERGFPQRVSAVLSAENEILIVRLGNGTSTPEQGQITISLPQIELNVDTPSSVIITTNSPVSRSQDTLYSSIINKREGSFYIRGSFDDSVFSTIVSLGSSVSSTLGHIIVSRFSDGRVRVGVRDDEKTGTEFFTVGNVEVGESFSLALSFSKKARLIRFSFNGETVYSMSFSPGPLWDDAVDSVLFGLYRRKGNETTKSVTIEKYLMYSSPKTPSELQEIAAGGQS